MAEQRKKIWIDKFQTHLALRIAFYFIFYQAAVWSLVIIENTIFVALEDMVGAEFAWYVLMFMIAAVVMVGVLFIYEAVKFVHRLVGPLVRFRRVVKAITAGEEVETIVLRKGDFLQELRDDFNEMLQVLEQRGVITIKQPAAKPDAKQTVAV